MAQIYNPDEIINKANVMKEQSNALKKLIGQMNEVVGSMSSVWQSPAQQSFSRKFEEIEPELSSFVTNINAFADRATEQANAVKKVEGDPV